MTGARRVAVACVIVLAGAAGAAGCGGGGSDGAETTTETVARTTTRVDVIESQGSGGGGRFDARAIYDREAQGVVTVISVFKSSGLSSLLGSDKSAGLGSGFVVSGEGEVATNAHVVTQGEGRDLERADQVFVQFRDRNQVPAKVVGVDPNADVALLKVDPDELDLRPLPLADPGTSRGGRAEWRRSAVPFGETNRSRWASISAIDRVDPVADPLRDRRAPCRPTPRSTPATRADLCSTPAARSSASTADPDVLGRQRGRRIRRPDRPRAASGRSAARERPRLVRLRRSHDPAAVPAARRPARHRRRPWRAGLEGRAEQPRRASGPAGRHRPDHLPGPAGRGRWRRDHRP